MRGASTPFRVGRGGGWGALGLGPPSPVLLNLLLPLSVAPLTLLLLLALLLHSLLFKPEPGVQGLLPLLLLPQLFLLLHPTPNKYKP